MPLALIALLLTPTTTILLAIIAFLIVVVALLGFVFLKARSRKLEEDARARDELAVREQESEFSRAVDAAVYARNAEDATKVLVTVLQHQLWLNVLAVYAGREDDSKLKNTLPQGASLTGGTEGLHMPSVVDPSLAKAHSRAVLVSLDSILGAAAETFSGPTSSSAAPDNQESEVSSVEAVTDSLVEAGDQGAPSPAQEVPEERAATQSRLRFRGSEFLIFPWSGSLGWTGLIVTEPQQGVTVEMLEAHRAPIERLTGRLAAALEIE